MNNLIYVSILAFLSLSWGYFLHTGIDNPGFPCPSLMICDFSWQIFSLASDLFAISCCPELAFEVQGLFKPSSERLVYVESEHIPTLVGLNLCDTFEEGCQPFSESCVP